MEEEEDGEQEEPHRKKVRKVFIFEAFVIKTPQTHTQPGSVVISALTSQAKESGFDSPLGRKKKFRSVSCHE